MNSATTTEQRIADVMRRLAASVRSNIPADRPVTGEELHETLLAIADELDPQAKPKPAGQPGPYETYRVTIRRENNEYVARDDQGNWRTRGEFKEFPYFERANCIARHLLHAEEIQSVESMADGGVVVMIYDYSKPIATATPVEILDAHSTPINR